jgi:hypothetical protein
LSQRIQQSWRGADYLRTIFAEASNPDAPSFVGVRPLVMLHIQVIYETPLLRERYQFVEQPDQPRAILLRHATVLLSHWQMVAQERQAPAPPIYIDGLD